jgi:hypothetical protein
MKYVTHNIPQNIRLWNLGDVHWASPECDRELVKKAINEIYQDPTSYWVSTGDLFDVNVRSGKHLNLGAMTVRDELEAMAEVLKPIANRCLGIVKSNHHHRVEKETSLCLDELLILQMGGSSDLALGYTGVLRLIPAGGFKTSWIICMHHGTGGGKLRGSKAVGLERLEHLVHGCDIYLEGHTHSMQYFINHNHVLDRHNNKLREQSVTFVTTGHFLQYGGYAEREKLRPAPVGCAIVELRAVRNGPHSGNQTSVTFWRG